MAEVRLSEQARLDLQEIRSIGIERFGKVAAERHLREIRAGLDLLSNHPLAGQERPEFRDGVRSLARRPHRLLYTVAADAVLIVRIIHQRRDVVAALQEAP